MKIGLLNPWTNAAENQLIPTISRVAESSGHTAVECKNTQDILKYGPDLVIAMSRTQAKLTDIPTYGLLFDPRDILLERSEYLANFFSYDGVFTLFDTLRTFAEDLLFAARRDEPIGYFFPTSMKIDWPGPITFETARLAYFGINWDRRRQELFTTLDRQPWMDIYGPPHGWTFLNGSAYKGTVPFDGISVMQRYHDAGVGLCLFSDSHFADDIVSSRIFEVSAAGALIMAPKMPWLERNYGDCILYIDQYLPDGDLAQQIAEHMAWIRQHPTEAQDMAARSEAIFRERFSLEVLLANVFTHHQQVQARQEATTSDRLVSVIVRHGNADSDALRRTLQSVVRQQHQRIELVTMGQLGEPRLDVSSGGIAGFQTRFERVVDVPSTSTDRSSGLWPGLEACSGDFIAVIDRGDEWMPLHLSSLLASTDGSPERKLAFSGSVHHAARTFVSRGGSHEVRRLQPFPFFHPSDDIVRDVATVPLGSCLFHRSLLDRWLLQDPHLGSLDEPYLLLSLLEKTVPSFTYRATMIRYESEDGSNFEADPGRREDLARLHLRYVGRPFPPTPRLIGFEALQQVVQRVPRNRSWETDQVRHHDGVTEYQLPSAFAYTVGPEEGWETIPLDTSLEDLEISGKSFPLRSDTPFPLVVEPPPEPWAYGLAWPIQFPDDRPHVLRLHCRVEHGTAAFGVSTWQRQSFEYRVLVPSQDGTVIVNLPIPHPSEVGPIVVQGTHSATTVRVVIEAAQLFAASERLPLTATKQFMQENEHLQTTLSAVQRECDVLIEELTRSRERVRQIRSSRLWQFGTLYWRVYHRLHRTHGKTAE